MEEVKNEEVTEEVIQENAPAEKQKPALNLGKFQSEGNDSVFKVDLSKPVEPKEVVDEAQTDLEESIEQVKQEEEPDNEVPALEEVTNEEPITEEKVMEALDENEDTGKEIPENVKKLMDFMDETGGDLNDYVNLNRDVSKLDSQDALREYYKKTKPHLDSEEINFLMEDNFSFDEDVDDERDIKRKKLALKEQVAEAKTYLDGQKSKYYEEIKAGSKLTTEQQNAVNFFDRYNKESEGKKDVANQRKSTFTKKTEQVFNNEFKGFDFEVGDKKFRYNVKDVNTVKESQSDINNFIGKFLDESSNMSDAKGYHKGLYTAMNPDSVAQHFYEQGKADALKSSVEKAKNVNVAPRQSHGSVDVGGVKYRVLGDSANDFKLRVKKRK
tara:strand:- start:2478 stop:3629 length:1152 start_codon:yes stop_codon:yes gene_type:complete